jgi:hypothetical protein
MEGDQGMVARREEEGHVRERSRGNGPNERRSVTRGRGTMIAG